MHPAGLVPARESGCPVVCLSRSHSATQCYSCLPASSDTRSRLGGASYLASGAVPLHCTTSLEILLPTISDAISPLHLLACTFRHARRAPLAGTAAPGSRGRRWWGNCHERHPEKPIRNFSLRLMAYACRAPPAGTAAPGSRGRHWWGNSHGAVISPRAAKRAIELWQVNPVCAANHQDVSCIFCYAVTHVLLAYAVQQGGFADRGLVDHGQYSRGSPSPPHSQKHHFSPFPPGISSQHLLPRAPRRRRSRRHQTNLLPEVFLHRSIAFQHLLVRRFLIC